MALAAIMVLAAGSLSAATPTLSLIHAFNTDQEGSSGSVSDGAMPKAALTLGTDGFLYGVTSSGGTTSYGGVSANGTLFKVKPDGSGFTTLYTFSTNDSKDGGGANSDGANPSGALIQGTDGNFYGTAQNGGLHNAGTVFKISPNGAFQTLHSFAVSHTSSQGNIVNTDGANPHAALTIGGDGYYYSTTFQGGVNGAGTIFRIKGDGTGFQTIHVFSAGDSANHNADGAILAASLTLGGDGLLYGTALVGGANGDGTVYRLARDGTGFTVIHTFPAAASGVNTGGSNPAAGLTLGGDGFFYGVTASGGPSADGTVFRVTPDGKTFQSLYSFSAVDANGDNADGAGPTGGLTLGRNGFLYGAAGSGGVNGVGTLFQISPSGSGFAALYSFSPLDANGDNADGANSYAGLIQGGDGSVYGTTSAGGPNGTGTLFRFSLSPTTHLLWRNVNGQASVWAVNADGTYASTAYGPFPGWTARAVAAVPDGSTDLLWTNTNGAASLWHVTASGYATIQYGPFAGYTAVSLSVGSDGNPHLLWDKSNGAASLWTVNKNTGAYTYVSYGPFAGWTATQVASGNTVTDLLWTNTNGVACGYRIAANGSLTYHTFGPFANYAAASLSVGPADGAHLLWDKTGGTAALWNADFTSGAFTYTNYGPFSGWAAKAIATGPDSVTHILWDKSDGTASLWSLAGSGYTHHEYGPYSGWTAVAVSAGP